MECMEYMEMVKNRGIFNSFFKMCVRENILLVKSSNKQKCLANLVFMRVCGL